MFWCALCGAPFFFRFLHPFSVWMHGLRRTQKLLVFIRLAFDGSSPNFRPLLLARKHGKVQPVDRSRAAADCFLGAASDLLSSSVKVLADDHNCSRFQPAFFVVLNGTFTYSAAVGEVLRTSPKLTRFVAAISDRREQVMFRELQRYLAPDHVCMSCTQLPGRIHLPDYPRVLCFGAASLIAFGQVELHPLALL
jgi:hypothetical protein